MSEHLVLRYLGDRPPTSQEFFREFCPEMPHTMAGVIEVPGEPSVHLRHVAYSDTYDLTCVAERNRENFSKYLQWAAEPDLLTMLARVRDMLSLSNQNQGMAYCIVEGAPESPGEVIGLNRLFNRYPHYRIGLEEDNYKFDIKAPLAFCGFWLDKAAQGQGIVPRTCQALFAYAQERWGIEHIFLDIGIGNEAAERCARSMGALATGLPAWNAERGDIENQTAKASAYYYQKKRSRNIILMQKWLIDL